ncbi:hypothetical protein F6H22_08925 [Vibrio cholerae]|nr:hypothetical protein [Vibrio cholerae]EGQ9332447.1 hypothetical protein [Vibrio cholerae]
MMGPKQTERGPITKSDGTKMGPKRGLNRVIFSTLLFIKTVLVKNKAPLTERFVERFSVTANRG